MGVPPVMEWSSQLREASQQEWLLAGLTTTSFFRTPCAPCSVSIGCFAEHDTSRLDEEIVP